MEDLPTARVTTIGALHMGDKGFIHPVYVMYQREANVYWVHPLCPVYETLAIGALIERRQDGYTIQIVHGREPSSWNKLTSPGDEGYIQTIECVREEWY